MSNPHAILRPPTVAYRRMRQGVWDLVFPTSTHHPSPRQCNVASTLPVSIPDRPSLAHGRHAGGGHI
jgi:hypothetical protein